MPAEVWAAVKARNEIIAEMLNVNLDAGGTAKRPRRYGVPALAGSRVQSAIAYEYPVRSKSQTNSRLKPGLHTQLHFRHYSWPLRAGTVRESVASRFAARGTDLRMNLEITATMTSTTPNTQTIAAPTGKSPSTVR